jgi:type IV pilus assembly protein PilC
MSLIVTPGELNKRAELYHQLGSMLSAGIPLIQALELIQNRRLVPGFGRVLASITQSLQEGDTFTRALTKAKGSLSAFDLALLSAGEQSGRLDVSFQLLAHYYENKARLIRDTLTGLFPTLATVHVFLLIFPLPFLQGAVINGNWWAYFFQKAIVFGPLYFGVFSLIALCQGNRGEIWRTIVEQIANMIPVLGTARRQLALARLSAALESLVNAGVPVIASWELAGAASGSPRLHRIVKSWKSELETGETPADLVSRTQFFPEMFANLYRTGELSGQQDDTLRRLHAYYQEEGFRKMKLFSRLFNGSVYGLVVIMVAIQVISFYVGYFNGIFSNF